MQYKIGDTVFDGWEITKEIGSGAYSHVYEIQKSEYGIRTLSALKVMRIPASEYEIELALSEGSNKSSVYRYFRGIVDELAKEIVVMTKLQGHPCIVSYQDHHIEEERDKMGWEILIRMELLEPLVKYQLRKPEMEEAQIVLLGMNISSALSLCHKMGIIHRDIKLENVFWSQAGGLFKLGDFGIARTMDKTENNLSRRGTMSYMPPEIYNGKPYGKTADIYSLGILLYRCANHNRLPFYPVGGDIISFEQRELALNRRMIGESLPLPCGVSPELGSIILKACEYDPEKRWQSAEELYAALSELNVIHRSIEEPEMVPEDLFGSVVEEYGREDSGKILSEVFGSGAEAYGREDSNIILNEVTGGLQATENEKTVSYDQDWIVPVQSANNEGKDNSSRKKPSRRTDSGGGKWGSLKRLPYLAAVVIISTLAIFLYQYGRKMKETYSVYVADGSIRDDEGNGKYTAGSQITLQADKKNGYRFSRWEVEQGSAEIEDVSSEKTIAVTGGTDTSIRAVYTVDCEYMKERAVGDSILFGAVEQDNVTENGKEDIEWIILENDGETLLVISKYALDCQPYNEVYIEVTWRTCDLRRWLNGVFLNDAFTDEEQQYIKETNISNPDNAKYGIDGGWNTWDKVFLLSIDEAIYSFPGDDARMCEVTAYAEARGAHIDPTYDKYCWWWLRSPGETANYAATVVDEGGVYQRGGNVHYRDYCVRPAMRIRYEEVS